ncbi:MAG: hypothetical protein A2505_02295 [Deltaproteobacteria bacterium RIFOXYD12_FULL_55_16]|nr:MAG: hypothetical protein A2505_02295 [Deltaproteobacteria bacterium RIFOXYD12_FULL_55_16]
MHEQYHLLQNHVLLGPLVMVIFYALLAKLADLFIDRVVRRLAERTSIKYDDQLVAILHRPLCWSIFLLGLLHTLIQVEPPAPYRMVLAALIKTVLIVFWLIATVQVFNLFVEEALARMVERGKIGSDLFLLLKNLLRVVLVVLGAFWVLSVWQVNLTPLFASAGIAGIAVALAAKDTLANFFGGVSIFADKTFKVGDYIILDNAQRGEVVEIGIRSTRIKTRDDVLITIPNSLLANSQIINESAPDPRYRIRIPLGVAYDSDLGLVEATLLEVAKANAQVILEPEPIVRYRAFGESAIELELLLLIEDSSLKGRETHRLIKAIHQAFTTHGIIIPFPQREVHLKNDRAATPSAFAAKRPLAE